SAVADDAAQLVLHDDVADRDVERAREAHAVGAAAFGVDVGDGRAGAAPLIQPRAGEGAVLVAVERLLLRVVVGGEGERIVAGVDPADAADADAAASVEV